MIVSASFKFDVPTSNCQHKGAAQVLTFQPRASDVNVAQASVLLYDKLLKFRIFEI